MSIYTTSEGKTIELGDLLGIGGEGAVYKIRQSPYVVKILNAESLKSDKSREAKLKVMIDSHPFEYAQAETKHTIAWPKALVYDEHKKFVGYTMPSISQVPELHLITNPSNRKKIGDIHSLENLYYIAYNIAIIFESLHKKNIVVGDISSKNILVNDDSSVAMVDCDSMQITDDKGIVYKCKVGTPEYTSPELHGKDLATHLRTINHDCFGLAVIIFQLLMQGNNPFSGRQDINDEEIVDLPTHCKINHIFPYDTMTPNKSIMVPLMAPDFEKCIPVNMQKLFKQAFTTDARPTATMWKKELASNLLIMTRCTQNQTHRHPQQTECTFCNWHQKQLNMIGSIATLNQTPYVAPQFIAPQPQNSTPPIVKPPVAPPSRPSVVTAASVQHSTPPVKSAASVQSPAQNNANPASTGGISYFIGNTIKLVAVLFSMNFVLFFVLYFDFFRLQQKAHVDIIGFIISLILCRIFIKSAYASFNRDAYFTHLLIFSSSFYIMYYLVVNRFFYFIFGLFMFM
jgi:DNA-binding helix-hairpin-helix protein with protein kinase domain